MNQSILHSTNLGYLPVMLALAFGSSLFFLWIPFVCAGLWRTLSYSPRLQAVYLTVAPLVMAFLYWFGVPDNLDCRFLLPVTMLAVLPVPRVFGANRVWNAGLHAVLALGLLWVAVGPYVEAAVEPLPWPIGNWLTFGGMVTAEYSWWFVALIAGMLVLAWC